MFQQKTISKMKPILIWKIFWKQNIVGNNINYYNCCSSSSRFPVISRCYYCFFDVQKKQKWFCKSAIGSSNITTKIQWQQQFQLHSARCSWQPLWRICGKSGIFWLCFTRTSSIDLCLNNKHNFFEKKNALHTKLTEKHGYW